MQNHNGNLILRNVIAEYRTAYTSAPKREKRSVSWKVVMATKMLGGRFLKRLSNGWWIEVSDEIAQDKISMAYRTSRSPDVPQPMTTIQDQPS